MKVIVVDKKNKITNKIEYRLNLFIEWAIYMVCYAFVLVITSNIFKSLYIENFWYGLLAAIILYILNKTLKPIIVSLTIPIIGITLGLFYFIINLGILFLTDLILGSHVNLNGVFSPFVVSIFISVMNIMMENIIIKPLIERCDK